MFNYRIKGQRDKQGGFGEAARLRGGPEEGRAGPSGGTAGPQHPQQGECWVKFSNLGVMNHKSKKTQFNPMTQ